MATEVFARGVVVLTEENRGLKRKAEQSEEELKRLEKRLVDATCTICQNANNNVLLKCGHKLCTTCLDSWRAQHADAADNVTTCPFCRNGIVGFKQF